MRLIIVGFKRLVIVIITGARLSIYFRFLLLRRLISGVLLHLLQNKIVLGGLRRLFVLCE